MFSVSYHHGLWVLPSPPQPLFSRALTCHGPCWHQAIRCTFVCTPIDRTGLWVVLQAADEAETGYGGELQQVEQQLAALDEELAKQGSTQAPGSESC